MVACGVSYDSNLREVERVCLEIASEVFEEFEAANTEFAPRIRFFEFADSNINFRIIFQDVDRVAMIAIQHEIIMCLHERFKEDGIEINYPSAKAHNGVARRIPAITCERSRRPRRAG